MAQTELWDESVRLALKIPRFKKKDLDDRRAKAGIPLLFSIIFLIITPKNIVPGTSLNPTQQDNRIPVLLIQRSVEVEADSKDQGVHGWTLIIPSGWSMAFFSSLIFTGTRVGGQRERQFQAFESGAIYFPRDYVSSPTYDRYAADREEEERTAWERKPPAKRVNYEKLGVRSPWRADWHIVLGISSPALPETGFMTTQREELAVDPPTNEDPIWLLRGSDVPKIISSLLKVFNHSACLLEKLNDLRGKRGMELLDQRLKLGLMKGAVVNVRLTMCTRGAPGDLATIYAVPDDQARVWHNAVERAKAGKRDLFDEDAPEELKVSQHSR